MEERKTQIELLKSSSIMTWQHVNMHGRYNFKLDTDQNLFDFNKVKLLFIS